MRTVLLLLVSLAVFGCDTKNKKLEKPFIVTYKNVAYEKGIGFYQYKDKNGNMREFSDSPDAYKIGDTIK